ncbi:RAMP superfamily CRISPR-associated protein [Thermoflexus sp.]|uniref:RAMP superfamily CRISPR-associated protein n=1 Tax=Thermoflexus sp. TaxID=1969742 RepID=UPI0035E435A4
MPRNPNAEPKPFVLVDIPSKTPERKPAAPHEKFAGLTGRLELTVTVVSEYLFVGSGAYEFDPNHGNRRPDVWYTFYRRNDQLCVPGTSLKGAIRAIVEAISNSCVSQMRRPQERTASNAHKPCQWDPKKAVHENRLCPACRLFGTTGYRGRMHFTDFLPQEEIKPKVVKIGELWEPKRFDPTKRRFYERKTFQPLASPAPQQNFRFVEAVQKGTKFQGALLFENVSEAELGLLLHALGRQVEKGQVTIAFAPKLGGAKPRCFGSVEFHPERLRLWGGNIKGLLAPQEVQGNDMLQLLSQYLQACRNEGLLHEPSWTALKEGLKPKNERCPPEVY